jgi:hypothetical protein
MEITINMVIEIPQSVVHALKEKNIPKYKWKKVIREFIKNSLGYGSHDYCDGLLEWIKSGDAEEYIS